MIAVDREELCDRECLACTNADAKLCRRWAWLLDEGGAQVVEPLVERGGRLHCPKCDHIIAMKSFRWCPYCGQPLDRSKR